MEVYNSIILKNYKSDLKELIINTSIGLIVTLLAYTLFAIYFANNFSYLIFFLIIFLFFIVRFRDYSKSYYPYYVKLGISNIEVLDLVLKRKKKYENSEVKYVIVDENDKLLRIELQDLEYILIETKISELLPWIQKNNIRIGKINLCYQWEFEFVELQNIKGELKETGFVEMIGYKPNRKFY